ncbi:hypothetical protein NECAME_09646 [Necator americanus]|uniref:Uncharacterized protein n=1 Tax=Necator americanus TaxID=51031 RepID=W2TDY1_NECAM|nr:hypothetical protein NECAME_09646 [Necator americanus]ETN79779.1 hypothetical protein NECAME_09646 [Necator americanus]
MKGFISYSTVDENGCQITYISHSDPKENYRHDLKEENQPHLKPWIFAEQQMEFPRVDLSKCQPQEYEQEVIDEYSEADPSKEIDVEEE